MHLNEVYQALHLERSEGDWAVLVAPSVRFKSVCHMPTSRVRIVDREKLETFWEQAERFLERINGTS